MKEFNYYKAQLDKLKDFPLDKDDIVQMVDKINDGDKNPYTLEKILSYLHQDIIYYNEAYNQYSIILGKGNLKKGD